MIIRPYAEADRDAVETLWREVFAYPAPHNDPGVVLRLKRAWEKDLLYVAEQDGAVVGAVMAGYDGHRGWLYSLAVAPGARRQGIGGALVQRAEQALREKGCVKLNLQVLADNAEVVEFYRALGYRVEERISMGKLLQNPRPPQREGEEC